MYPIQSPSSALCPCAENQHDSTSFTFRLLTGKAGASSIVQQGDMNLSRVQTSQCTLWCVFPPLNFQSDARAFPRLRAFGAFSRCGASGQPSHLRVWSVFQPSGEPSSSASRHGGLACWRTGSICTRPALEAQQLKGRERVQTSNSSSLGFDAPG